ncbi:putative antirestriction adenine methyltransferase [Rhodococcus koreensis]
MFLGTIEPEIRSMVHEHTRRWDTNEYWIGCSGNFTIERFMHADNVRLHGNDVSIYTCALGAYLAGDKVQLSIKPEYARELAWLEPFMQTDADRIATLLLGTRFLAMVGKDGPYFTRMLEGFRRQYEKVHANTVTKVEASTVRLASFHPIDVREYLKDVVPADGAVISFPPFDTGGYETMFAPLEKHFDWPEPTYEILDADGVRDTFELIMDRKEWMFASNHRFPDLERQLVGVCQTSARRRTNFVYASTRRTRIVRPGDKMQPVLAPRMAKGDRIGQEIKLAPLTVGQFATLRAQYLNPGIRTSTPQAAYAVLSEGRILGCFAFLPPKFEHDVVYLMSDFAVAGTDYPKLSKLIVLAACSRESRHLMQNILSRKLSGLATTAFTNNPVSMKYRGVLVLGSRKDTDEPGFKFQLQYQGPLGEWTLAEGLARWKRQWGETR